MRAWRAARLVAAVVVGGVLAGTSAVSAQQADPDQAAVDFERYGAADRYATSLLVADAFVEHAGGSVDNVVMVSGRHWHDAVVAVPMASALGAPVVMTPPDRLRDDTAAFLGRVQAKHVIVVASGQWPDTAVSSQVHAQLENAGVEVFLTHGADRYRTGVAVARWLARLPGASTSAIIASGEAFADALAAGPLAYAARVPLLLTPPEQLHPDVATYLTEARITHVMLMGGTAALSHDVETAITELGITRVDRIAGTDRYDTAATAARYAATLFADTCFRGPHVGLARGDLAFDAASAAPLLAQRCAPLLLTGAEQLPQPTTDHLNSLRTAAPTVPLTVTIFGGTNAVPHQLLNPLTADPKP